MMPFRALRMRNPGAGGGGGLSSNWRINITARQTSGNFSSIAELEMRQTIGGSNSATGGTASASSELSGSEASKAFDGTTATRWTSNTSSLPNWLQYAFGGSVTINQIGLTPDVVGDTPTAFNVQYYDGAAWQDSWTEGTQDTLRVTGTSQLLFANPTVGTSGYTYWRLRITASQNSGGFTRIAKLELRATTGGADQAATALTSGGQPLANTEAGANQAKNAYDSDASSIWQANFAPTSGSPATLGMRFPTRTAVTEVSITNGTVMNDAVKSFSVQYWDPGTSAWVDSWSVADAAFASSGETKVFTKP